jgi:signal transduction histidine kinase
MKIAAREGAPDIVARPVERRIRIGARWLALTALAIALTGLGLTVTLRPSPADAMQIALYLALSGVFSVALGQGALWLADAARVGSVWLRLLLPPVITTLVIAFNVILVSRMMFIASEDAQVLLGFLLFGVALALMLSFSIASEMTRAITRIETGARRIAAGDYQYRIGEDASGGAEELARLARWFNEMAQSVQRAFEQRQVAEDERRQVVAAVSHDLRTPLTSVRAMIEAIDDGVVTDEATVRRYQRAIHTEVRRLSALMDDFFELSRLESGAFTLRRERLALDDLLSDALEASQAQAERKGVRLVGQVVGALPLVAVDARQLHRALTNLLQNALRYTGRGDAILLSATTSADAMGACWARITVMDSGSGIAPADLPHIFERTYRGEASRARGLASAAPAPSFAPSASSALSAPGVRMVSADDATIGAGLGLTITRGLIEAHGGDISAHSPLPDELRALIAPLRASSAPYRGTALIFTLPASDQAQQLGAKRSV